MVYELLPGAAQADADSRQRMVDSYRAALEAYIAGEWRRAKDGFIALVARFPSDRPSMVLFERCSRFAIQPPRNWEGAFEIHEADAIAAEAAG
jgi:hypothetical protein